jgi:hypothetical protein
MEPSSLVRRSSSSVFLRMSFKKRPSVTDCCVDAVTTEVTTSPLNGDHTIHEQQPKRCDSMKITDNLPSLRPFYLFSSFLLIDFIGMLILDTPLVSG